jgi:uncharacterized protein
VNADGPVSADVPVNADGPTGTGGSRDARFPPGTAPEPAPARAPDPFVVMAKPVGPACNIACPYCYYAGTAGQYARPHRFRMSDEMLERYVRQFIEASPGPAVHFCWHGGEPTLAGLAFFRRALELQRAYLPRGWVCWNNLQTNGTLLDDAWCSFLAGNGFEVGLSLDGPAALHDGQRPDRAGRGTHARVEASVRRLVAHGIRPALLCTVTAATATAPVDVYRYLTGLGATWLQFLPIVRPLPGRGVSADSVAPEAYGRFLCAVFDRWVQHDVDRVQVQLFAECLLAWSGRQPTLCILAETCGRALAVEHDGAVYPCDHFVAPEHRLGDLTSSHLGTLAGSPAQLRFGAAKRAGLPARCRSCPWLFTCGGGCPKHRFTPAEGGGPGINYLCDGLRAFFAHADPYLRRILVLSRQRKLPQEVMREAREAARARWRAVGRNDPCPCGSGRKAKHCCWATRP